MTLLWISIAGLVLIAVIVLCLPLITRQQVSAKIHDAQQNIAIFKDRLDELEQERQQGVMDDEAFELLKLELEKSLLVDVEGEELETLTTVEITQKHWVITASMAIFVMVTSLGLYAYLGHSDDYALHLSMKQQGTLQQQQSTDKEQLSFEKVIALLEKKLQQEPEDIEKWFLLANSYAAIGNYQKAASAYQSALTQMPEKNAQYAKIKGSYAQMLFQAAGEKITPEVAKEVQAVLAIDPMEASALILAGINAFTTGDIPQALVFWEKAKTNAQEQVVTGFLEPVIQQAKLRLGMTEDVAKVEAVTRDNNQAHIAINLDIDPSLKAKLNGDQLVFVFARLQGSRMPLAAQKLQVKDLPTSVVLDDTKSPMPTSKLSSAEVVNITARVSQTGSVSPKKGDFFVTIKQVKVKNNSTTLEMLINQIKE